MNKIIWDDSFSVGNPDMDAQHKKIIELINELIEFQELPILPEKVHNTLYEMFLYSKGHLYDEEKLLQKNGYAELKEHLAFHEEYIEQMTGLLKTATNQEKKASLQIIQFLRDWWEYHILTEDKKYSALFSDPGE